MGRKFCSEFISGSQGAVEAPVVAVCPPVAGGSPSLSLQLLLHTKLQSESIRS